LHYGTEQDPGLVMIDGGPSQVYPPHLKPRLDTIRGTRNLAAGSSLPVDLLMVSHIDDDHIKGILELTRELTDAKRARKPLPVKIGNLWHNSFDKIIGNDPHELTSAVTASFGAAALSGEVDPEDLEPSAGLVLASVPQGQKLSDDAKTLGLRVNGHAQGQVVMAEAGAAPVDLGKGLRLTVIGPMKQELAELQEEYDRFLKKKKAADKNAEAALAAFSDDSAANLSSIVVLAEAEEKRILLTGDARGDKILEGLELVGLLAAGGTMHVDVLKAPHHGSDRNMDPIFFRRVTADHYVFSGNGEHGNPERETLQMLLDERGDADITVHLTYPLEEIDAARKQEWEKQQRRQMKRKLDKPQSVVREDWSPERHGLIAFFDAHPGFSAKTRFVDPAGAHVIDLLDPLGF
jgi:hypothetical protein